ncbi:NADH:ubiquinone oxidoreductase subunit K [Dysgonomonas sp. PH5-45]|uniref:NADH-quinone oxidoreductase subunit NuoK n=1 Tax=unclassified Dysgonomonas TaxID=2630389 RepID=UPI00247523AE|nr:MULTISPECIES: NADH-quinone oxidoreductase subunit NuoK [unclassified Dysgonomonas]MDH6355745.1 NADH:ubiquinone oxidoreductase subunit K [Dysgonomonas sp. PH5-45]MDH6388642.1 NADH:ubiquinone oxidoreductase subunit K [Dysgonomonas sp. PH5-37]
MNNIPLEACLAVSTIMFFAGVYGFLSRKNMLMVLVSLELMLNAADLNFVVFNRYLFPNQMEGMFFTLFAVAIAAAETAVAIAIIINIYRNVKSVYIDENITTMKN